MPSQAGWSDRREAKPEAGLGWHWLQLESACRAETGGRPRKALGQVSQPLALRKTWKWVKSMELGWDVLRHMDSSLQEHRSQAKYPKAVLTEGKGGGEICASAPECALHLPLSATRHQ